MVINKASAYGAVLLLYTGWRFVVRPTPSDNDITAFFVITIDWAAAIVIAVGFSMIVLTELDELAKDKDFPDQTALGVVCGARWATMFFGRRPCTVVVFLGHTFAASALVVWVMRILAQIVNLLLEPGVLISQLLESAEKFGFGIITSVFVVFLVLPLVKIWKRGHQ